MVIYSFRDFQNIFLTINVKNDINSYNNSYIQLCWSKVMKKTVLTGTNEYDTHLSGLSWWCVYLPFKKRENSNITQMIHLLVELLTFYKTTRAG